MKKEEIYVSVESKEQAEMFRKVLEAMGEAIRSDYFKNTSIEQPDLDYRENGWILGLAGYKEKITFGELIDLLQRKPLLISEDGVELFEGNHCYVVNIEELDIFKHSYHVKDLKPTDQCLLKPDKYKAFSTREAAKQYIDSQNPKEIVIDLDKNELSLEAHCTEKSVSIFYTGKSGNPIKFTRNCIDKIYKAMEELKNA